MAIKILKFKQMKNILFYTLIIMLLASCESDEVIYPDYTYETVYFPIQNPVRTLVLDEESRVDNSIDLEHAFTIGASVGGIYNNTKERVLNIKYAPELVNDFNLVTTTNDTLVVLPETYYSASSMSEIVIPKGEFTGRIRIDLKDEFFNDAKTVGLKYVIPFIILPSTKDSILSGKPIVENPIRTINSHWEVGLTPKDYTFFAIKYTNKYHGQYFHYGLDSIFNAGVFTSRQIYSTPFVEDNTISTVKTLSLSESIIDRLGGTNVGGQYQMKLKFNDDKTITISSVEGGVPVSGTGTYKESKDGIVWGGKGHKTLFLKYNFKDDLGNEHISIDTLVYRSSGIVYEEFNIKQDEIIEEED